MRELESAMRDAPALFAKEHSFAGLPPTLRRKLEIVLRTDLASIRLAAEPNLRDFGARACVRGEEILLSPSVGASDEPEGLAVLAHELAHVLQQRAGRVASVSVACDEALEDEADRIAAHCLVRLFPEHSSGQFNDPGMPDPVWAGCAPVVHRGPQPIQFLVPSTQSFDNFVNAAWNWLNGYGAGQLSVPHRLNALYGLAAAYNPNNCPPKNRLVNQALYAAMQNYVLATQPCTIRMQASGPWPNLTNNVAALAQYYGQKAAGNNPPNDALAEQLTRTYLHVYPAQQAPANWRIGLNVEANEMAAAIAALVPLLNNHANIDHMKFLGPGDASKADSVIVYLDRQAQGYDQLLQAVLNAVQGLHLQPRVGAMWEEIRDGIGIASEPPMPGASFTTYRCLIVYLAYWAFQTIGGNGYEAYRFYLENILAVFGIDVDAPFAQGPLIIGFQYFNNWWAALTYLARLWRI